MEDMVFKVSFDKVMRLILDEERAKIRKHYMATFGQATADGMDSYVPTESEVLKLFTPDGRGADSKSKGE